MKEAATVEVFSLEADVQILRTMDHIEQIRQDTHPYEPFRPVTSKEGCDLEG